MKKKITFFFIMLLIIFLLQNIGATNYKIENELNVTLLPPDLIYDPIYHDFGFVEEGQTYDTTFQIWNVGTDILTWNLGIVHTWISPNPTSGSSNGEKDTVTVTIDTTGLSTGAHSGFVSIFANDGGGVRYFDVDIFIDTPPNKPNIPSGPNSGIIDIEYSYYTLSTDSDGDWIAYRFDFGNRISDWTMYTASGIGNTVHNIWTVPGTYNVIAQARDLHGAISEWSLPLLVSISSGENNPPNKPDTPSGATSGKTGISYSYSTSTTDLEGDQVYYWFDWGDGSNSGWNGPYNSGDVVSLAHIWSADGTYPLKVKAKDINDEESVWSDSLSVSMPKSKSILPFGNIIVFGFDVDVKIIQLEPGEDYVDLEVLSKPFYFWENGIQTRNPGEFIRLYTAKGLFSPSLSFCFGTCDDWGIIG
jgi:hypothetical protein